MSKSLNITLLMDEGWVPLDDPHLLRKGPSQTERHVATALRELGHTVRVLGAGYDVQAVVRNLEENPPDLVFNLAEQFADDRRKDKNLAALLEMMDLPFTGTGSGGMMLCRDKGLCKQLLGLHSLRAPRFALVLPEQPAQLLADATFPMIVKPVFEDASDGIANASLVRDAKELAERCRHVHRRWRQAAIVEEFIDGRELYVGVLGNDRLTVLPPRELRFGQGGPKIATRRVKADSRYRRKWNIQYGFARVSPEAMARIEDACEKVFRVLQLRDYCRVDLRLTAAGEVFVLEANPNPEIADDDEFAASAAKAGLSYNALIERIVVLARQRYS